MLDQDSSHHCEAFKENGDEVSGDFSELLPRLLKLGGKRSHQVFVQIGHLFLQLWGLDVGIRHPHHHHAPAEVVGEIDAFAHLSSDDREQQRSCESAAVRSTPLKGEDKGT